MKYQSIDHDLLETAYKHLSSTWGEIAPRFAFVLGSGWSVVADLFETTHSMDYADLPGMGAPGASGHAGVVSYGKVAGTPCLVFQGRRHLYEGAGWTPIALPVFLAAKCQVDGLIITNAAGGIHSDLHPGDLVLIKDHLNMMGANPLIGEHNPVWGESRFTNMNTAYNPELREMFLNAATEIGVELKQGVFVALHGPSYETPAEIGMLKTLGADAVGMSTVPEVTLGNAAGLRTVGISCITNYAAGLCETPPDHGEVIETMNNAQEKIKRLFERFLQ